MAYKDIKWEKMQAADVRTIVCNCDGTVRRDVVGLSDGKYYSKRPCPKCWLYDNFTEMHPKEEYWHRRKAHKEATNVDP